MFHIIVYIVKTFNANDKNLKKKIYVKPIIFIELP